MTDKPMFETIVDTLRRHRFVFHEDDDEVRGLAVSCRCEVWGKWYVEDLEAAHTIHEKHITRRILRGVSGT